MFSTTGLTMNPQLQQQPHAYAAMHMPVAGHGNIGNQAVVPGQGPQGISPFMSMMAVPGQAHPGHLPPGQLSPSHVQPAPGAEHALAAKPRLLTSPAGRMYLEYGALKRYLRSEDDISGARDWSLIEQGHQYMVISLKLGIAVRLEDILAPDLPLEIPYPSEAITKLQTGAAAIKQPAVKTADEDVQLKRRRKEACHAMLVQQQDAVREAIRKVRPLTQDLAKATHELGAAEAALAALAGQPTASPAPVAKTSTAKALAAKALAVKAPAISATVTVKAMAPQAKALASVAPDTGTSQASGSGPPQKKDPSQATEELIEQAAIHKEPDTETQAGSEEPTQHEPDKEAAPEPTDEEAAPEATDVEAVPKDTQIEAAPEDTQMEAFPEDREEDRVPEAIEVEHDIKAMEESWQQELQEASQAWLCFVWMSFLASSLCLHCLDDCVTYNQPDNTQPDTCMVTVAVVFDRLSIPVCVPCPRCMQLATQPRNCRSWMHEFWQPAISLYRPLWLFVISTLCIGQP